MKLDTLAFAIAAAIIAAWRPSKIGIGTVVVSESVAGFRIDCTVSRMRAIKRHSAELREHCARVNMELQELRAAAGADQSGPPDE